MAGRLRSNTNGTNRKRAQIGGNNKKKTNPQKELDENLLAMEAVNAESCWKIYRLHENACTLHFPPQPKPKNCKQNPYCIHRLGFEKIEKIFQNLQEGKSAADIITRRNREEQPCGLVNTGNYCYLNSFLQIWFNDVRFRQCIFDWRPHAEWVKPDGVKLDIQEVLNCLQRLFITLQNTPFDSTNPKEFINLLRLDNEQQDVQEFHTLFFDTLERNLQVHPNGQMIHRTINELFLSRLRQVTGCQSCGNERTAFCEYRSLLLSIDGLNSLHDAITKFLEPENLSDFKCTCGKTGLTNKWMAFETLPQVLIIQLIRYVYDSAKEQNRKLKTAISYPRVLKATKLKPDVNNAEEYELSAVMIHEGPNSHSGHYYDIIRDPITNRWFSYNDKRVEAEKREPGYDKEPPSNQRATNDQKGCYALIYQRKKLPAPKKNAKIEFRMPPEEVVRDVCKKLEDDFARQSNEGTRSNELWEYRIRQRYAYLSNLIMELEVENGLEWLNRADEIVFIPTAIFTDLFTKEYEAIRDMRTIDDQMLEAPPPKEEVNWMKEKEECDNIENTKNGHKPLSRQAGSAGSHQKLAKSDSVFSFDGMEHDDEDDAKNAKDGQKEIQNCLASQEVVYAPEPLAESKLIVCKHDNVPLNIVLKGELKAVREMGARRLVQDFNLRLLHFSEDPDEENKTPSDEALIENGSANDIANDQPCTSAALAKSPLKTKENGNQTIGRRTKEDLANKRFLTGADLCFDCIKEFRNHATFRHDLSATEDQLSETMKNLARRAYDPNRPNQIMAFDPPERALWFSLADLRNFKKIALDQLQKSATDLNMDDDDEPAEKRSKEDNINEGNDEYADLADDQNIPSSEEVICVDEDKVQNGKESAIEYQDEEDDDIEVVNEENLAEKNRSPPGYDEQGREIFDVPEDADKEQIIEDNANEKKTPIKFNQDIYCKHGKLSNKTKRAWLTEEEWNKMKWCFSDYAEPIPCTAQECLICTRDRDIIQRLETNSLDQFLSLQTELKALLSKIVSRRPGETGNGKNYTNVICKEFVTKMRNTNRARQKIIPEICQQCLLCRHGQPYLPLASENDQQEADIKLFPIFAQNGGKNEAGHAQGIPLFESEWRQLVNAYQRHSENQKQPTEILLLENGQYLDFCDNCFLEFSRNEEMKQYIYPEGATIFVKKQDDADDKPNATPSSSRPAAVTTRRCAQKSLLKVKMRSDQTITDLKMELMKQIRASPIDQLLYLGENMLDNDLTLEAARVPANNQANPLILILQQHDTDDTGTNSQKPRERERGFRDTALA